MGGIGDPITSSYAPFSITTNNTFFSAFLLDHGQRIWGAPMQIRCESDANPACVHLIGFYYDNGNSMVCNGFISENHMSQIWCKSPLFPIIPTIYNHSLPIPTTVERVIFAPAIFSRFFENEVFAQCYFRGSRRSRKKHGRGKKMNSKLNTAAVKKRQRKKRSTRCRLQTLY